MFMPDRTAFCHIICEIYGLGAPRKRFEQFDCLPYVGIAPRLVWFLALNAEYATVTDFFQFMNETIQTDTTFAEGTLSAQGSGLIAWRPVTVFAVHRDYVFR